MLFAAIVVAVASLFGVVAVVGVPAAGPVAGVVGRNVSGRAAAATAYMSNFVTVRRQKQNHLPAHRQQRHYQKQQQASSQRQQQQQQDWDRNWVAFDFGESDVWQAEQPSGHAPVGSARRRLRAFERDEHSQRYQLRYNPVALMPRLFWHKLPQQEEPSPSPPATVAPAEPMPEEPETEKPELEPELEKPTPEPEQPAPEPEPITTAAPAPKPVEPEMPMTNTTTAKPLRPPKRPTPATTMTSIMRPPIALKPPLKNLLIYGSPFNLNLLQKQKYPSPTSAVKSKSKGFLSLFEVIKFDNVKCSVSMGDIRSMHGVCYHEFECKNLGGIPTERCAEGAGVCCIFLTGCGDSTEQSLVYFESPNYPNAVREMMMCVLVVNLRKNVQQLRIDFLMFELSRPTNGDCLDDQFIVTGQNINFAIPILCGINTGQHIYIHAADSSERKIYLSFFAKVVSATGRSFNLKVTQLESDYAPDGCLQYFREADGVIKSFNYDRVGSIIDNMEATYLNNLNYAMCLERLKGICSVVYSTEQVGGDLLDFQILNKDADETDLVQDGQAGAGIFNCPDDFIGVNEVRLCGERFNDGTDVEDFTVNAMVRDVAAGPFVLPFRSDDLYVGRGFRLLYKQEACV